METKNKGGRIARLNADYFSLSGTRSPQLKYLKMKYGSEGIDFYVSIFETLCVSPHFIWEFGTNYQLEVFLSEKKFEKERFQEMLNFSVVELGLFDKTLFEKGLLFSVEFVAGFNQAGLFNQRSIKAADILRLVNSKRGDATPLTIQNLSIEDQLRKNINQIDDGLPF